MKTDNERLSLPRALEWQANAPVLVSETTAKCFLVSKALKIIIGNGLRKEIILILLGNKKARKNWRVEANPNYTQCIRLQKNLTGPVS